MSTQQITVGSLIALGAQTGFDVSHWRARALKGANDNKALDVLPPISELQVENLWGNIPARQWMLGTLLVAGFYTMLVSQGGSGKSALAIALAAGLALGRGDIAGMHIRRPYRVAVINLEDDTTELTRRARALAQYHGLAAADFQGQLLLVGAGQIPSLRFTTTDERGRAVVDDTGLDTLERLIVDYGLEAVVIDPLSSACPGGLNENNVMSQVARRLSGILARHGAALLIVHHSGKAAIRTGMEGDATAGLGATTIMAHARSAMALLRPTEAEATNVGVTPAEAWRHVYLQPTKSNLAPPGDRAWYKLESVTLPNADPARGYPTGDNMQVMVPWVPGTRGDIFSDAVWRTVLDTIASGAPAGPFSPSGQKGGRNYTQAVASAVAPFFPNNGDAEHLAKQAVKELIGRGWVRDEEVRVPRGSGKGGGPLKRKGLLVDWGATPWSNEPPPTGAYVSGITASLGVTP
jgi:hypothetical protein